VTSLVHEVWRDSDSVMMCLAGPMGNQARSMLTEHATLAHTFVADNSLAAGQRYYDLVGFGEYRSAFPELDAQPYPASWGAIQRGEQHHPPSTPPNAQRLQVEALRQALVLAERNSDFTQAHARVAPIVELKQQDAAALLHRATKRSKLATIALGTVMLERGDVGCSFSDAWIERLVRTPAHVARSSVMGSMALDRRRMRFAPLLRELARDRGDDDWPLAVHALGEWRDADAAVALMVHADGVRTPFVLLQALVKLRVERAASVLEANTTHAEARTRTFAWWGLAALGRGGAVRALVALLDDVDVTTATSHEPGQQRRAAQALADLWGLQFEWDNLGAVAQLRAHAMRRLADGQLDEVERR
jgi:hypothetical protein